MTDDYLSREPLHIASLAALLMFMLSIIPKMSRLNDAFMKRMMAGSDADNDEEDGEIAAASAALNNDEDDEIDEAFVMQLVQHDMALAWGFLALLLRRETQALAVSPFIKKDPTDFFAWLILLFHCLTHSSVSRKATLSACAARLRFRTPSS